jgi:hypothetical protein
MSVSRAQIQYGASDSAADFFRDECRECETGSDYRMKAQSGPDRPSLQGRVEIGHSDAELRRKSHRGHAMTTLTPYLLFDGNCKQAMEFYKSSFDGELTQIPVKDSPAKDSMPAFQPVATEQKIIRENATGEGRLLGSATPPVTAGVRNWLPRTSLSIA